MKKLEVEACFPEHSSVGGASIHRTDMMRCEFIVKCEIEQLFESLLTFKCESYQNVGLRASGLLFLVVDYILFIWN